ncbi:MAG: hypothetical protein ACJA1E_000913 [Paracoccaceae bacterium]|jgi:hypothetical protein
MAKGWHIVRNGPVLTLSRHLPARFDFESQVRLPRARRAALAHQIRQDVWRALQHVRGFSPVIEVTDTGHDVIVRAGGRMLPPSNVSRLHRMVAFVLENRDNQRRWGRFSTPNDTLTERAAL